MNTPKLDGLMDEIYNLKASDALLERLWDAACKGGLFAPKGGCSDELLRLHSDLKEHFGIDESE